jgi:cytoskeleton protein RodZ
MASAVSGEQRCGAGARLRAARENRGLLVPQAAERLHFDARIVEALEAEDFAALGADVYVRGYLRRYAELVGESPEELLGLYAHNGLVMHPDLTRIPHREPVHGAARLGVPALLGVAGLALIVLLWWVITLEGEKPQPLAGAAAAATEARATASAPGAAAGGVPLARAGTRTQLAVKFSALSWAEVYDASGKLLLQGLYAGGASRTLSGTPPLRVTVGNTPAVTLEVNGQPVLTEGLARRDGTAHLLIDAEGHASPAPPRLAHGG